MKNKKLIYIVLGFAYISSAHSMAPDGTAESVPAPAATSSLWRAVPPATLIAPFALNIGRQWPSATVMGQGASSAMQTTADRFGAVAHAVSTGVNTSAQTMAEKAADTWRFAGDHRWSLAALGAFSAATYSYWYYRTAYMDPRVYELRQLYTQVVGLLEYALYPWDQGKQEIWRQWMEYPSDEFERGISDIEKNLGILGVRRGFLWGHIPSMSNAVRVVEAFRNQILYQKGLEERAAAAGRAKPLPGETFQHAVKNMALLIAASLTKEEEAFLRGMIGRGETEAERIRQTRLMRGAASPIA